MNFKVLGILLFLAVCTKASCGHSHEHDHFHEEEPIAPSFKYSRQANEKFQKPSSQINSRGSHDHGHGHSHDHDHDHHHDHHHDPLPTPAKIPSSTFDIWLHSLVSTLLISAAPFFILYFVPLDNTEKMHTRLKTLLAFASGGLLGDAFLHLIPHSSHSAGDEDHAHFHTHTHSHEESHSHHSHTEDSSGHGHSHSHTIDMRVGLWVLAGIIAFLAVEKIIRLMKLGHTHSHSHGSPKPTKEKEVAQIKPKNEKVKNLTEKVKDTKEKLVKEKKEKDHTSLHVAGYLNLAADFTHNFTDGLAIGASYLAGSSVGMITTVAILLHEIPHEIGDFAILIKSGCSRKKAMLLQLITAVGALAGNLLALLGSNIDASSSWILPFTAGGFIYIATVSVIPELLEDSTKLGQSLKEIFAMLLGVAMMVLIAYLE